MVSPIIAICALSPILQCTVRLEKPPRLFRRLLFHIIICFCDAFINLQHMARIKIMLIKPGLLRAPSIDTDHPAPCAGVAGGYGQSVVCSLYGAVTCS